MQIGDLVTVEKKPGVVVEGIIVGITDPDKPAMRFNVFCFEIGTHCYAHPLDVKKMKMTGEENDS
jgi:hypothetical protein